MAVEIGTATGHIDLMNKLMTFLSTNADLVAAGQNWEVLRNAAYPINLPAPARIGFTSNTAGSWPAVLPDPWPINLPSSNCKTRIAGKLNIPSSGNYNFGIIANTQAQLYIDGVLIGSSNSANHSTNAYTNSFPATLTAGLHDFRVDAVFGGNFPSGLSLGWQKPGDSAIALIPAGSYSAMTMNYGWTEYWNPSAADIIATAADKEYIIRGPGLADADDIYLALRTTSSNQDDLYNVRAQWATGFDDGQLARNQPGIGQATFSLMWNQAIPYWFIANGRRFIVIAKVSTTYASIYGGFMLPYGLPSEMPYPIVSGANSGSNARWSDQSADNSSFWNPASAATDTTSSLLLRRTNGNTENYFNIWSTGQGPASVTYPFYTQVPFRSSPDNSYALTPTILVSTAEGGNVWGELQGVYHVSGNNNASENIMTIDGKNYLVVQSAFRTTPGDYAAILLE